MTLETAAENDLTTRDLLYVGDSVPFVPTGEAKFGDVHRLLTGLVDSFPTRADSRSTTRGLRSQPYSDNQESFWFSECRYVTRKIQYKIPPGCLNFCIDTDPDINLPSSLQVLCQSRRRQH